MTLTRAERPSANYLYDEDVRATEAFGYEEKNELETYKYYQHPPFDNIFAQLGRLLKEACSPNWDGYGADSVEKASVNCFLNFMTKLNFKGPAPELGVEPSGELTADWEPEDDNRLLSLGFSSDNAIHYLYRKGEHYESSTFQFADKIPDLILKRIIEMYG